MARPGNATHGLPPHVHLMRKGGRCYYYFQRARATAWAGPRTRLPGIPFDGDGLPDAAWWQAYRQASGQSLPLSEPEGAGTFARLINDYQDSPEWRALATSTSNEWLRGLKRVEEAWGRLKVAGLEPHHVLKLRDQYAETPAQTNNMLRGLSAMLSWAVPRGWLSVNPVLTVKKLKGGKGYVPWSWEAICLFEREARPEMWQAAALALYSGQRQGDVMKLRWDCLRDGYIALEQEKTGKELDIPVHDRLAPVIATLPRRHAFLLSDTKGNPWDVERFRTVWGRELDRPVFASLRAAHLVFHGLRKSAVVMLLEAGCTDAEVASITGQSRQMIEHYSRRVNNKKLAAAAILKWQGAARKVPDGMP